MAHQLELILFSIALNDHGYFCSPLDGMVVHHRVTPNIKFVSTYFYTRVERGTVRVKCLAQIHNAIFPARVELRPLDLKTSALTMRPLRLPHL